jgi:uncharacterized membrane protein
MFELLILIVIAFPVTAIVGVVLAIGTRDRMRTLEFRLGRIEKRLSEPGAAPTAVAPIPVAPMSAAPGTPPETPATPEPGPEPELLQAGIDVRQSGEPQAQEPQPAAAPPFAPVPPPPLQPGASAPAPSLEERFGTQIVVWIGGIAVALGGFFLVRYSIQQDWFGAGMRVSLGALLAIALIVAGEWARRTEQLSTLVSIPTANIPAILTAAGTAVAYADVWAAYGLYNFIGSAVAFLLLGIVALATLAAALLHGPALAGFGLVGAYVTPIIVSSDRPNYWALYLFLAVVTAAAFVLARARLWRWLAITAVVFGVLWTFPGIQDYRVDWLTPHNFHVVAGFVLVALLMVSGLFFGPDAKAGEIDPVSSGALGAYLFASTALVLASGHDPLALMTFTALVAGIIAIAWRAEAATAAVPVAALLTLLVFADWALQLNVTNLVAPSGPTAGAVPEPAYVGYTWHLVLGALFAALFGIAGYLAQGRSEQPAVPMLWAASAVFAPLAILVALYYRIAGFDRSVPFAGMALLLALAFGFATEMLGKRVARPGVAAAGAIFATGAVAALALALTMTLEKGWLTIALALMVPGVAWVSDKRPLPALRVLVGVLVALVLARVAWDPRIVGRNVGTMPVFNWILYGYGIPCAAFWLGGHILRRRADDGPARLADAAALLFAVLLAFLEIRHFMNHGEIFRDAAGLAEVALQVSVGLAMVIGLERLRAYTKSVVHDVGALIVAGLTLLAIVFGLFLFDNPIYTGEPVGGRFINLILLGYLLPAALMTALALQTRGARPQGYSTFAAVVAVGLALAYLTLEVRRIYQGPVLSHGLTSDAEQYTYSAIWLAFGVALLAVGKLLESQAVRIASAAVVVLTIVKVGFVDMSKLTGLYQALSVLGLGLVLLGIGWFYQRVLFPRRAPAPGPAPT